MSTAKERVEKELEELEERLTKLKAFVLTEVFSKLSKTQQILLLTQIDIMTSYQHCLRCRLLFWED